MEANELIISRLDDLKQDIQFVKEHIIDITLTQDDVNSLNEAEKDLEKGNTKRL